MVSTTPDFTVEHWGVYEAQRLSETGRFSRIAIFSPIGPIAARRISSSRHWEQAEQTLTRYFKVKTLLVTEDSDEASRRQARELGRQNEEGNGVPGSGQLLMLREGWDVPEVGVILLLRKFGSRVYGQQVIGRGLRRVRAKKVHPDEPQICAAVDHPKLEHQWLWDIFNAKKREGVSIDDSFDEMEDHSFGAGGKSLRRRIGTALG